MKLPRCGKTAKVGFPNREQAEARALFIVDFMRREGALRAYRCPDCRLWHLTKRVPPQSKRAVVAPQRAA